MAVGDDDQGIYRFQTAQISNARQFMESYKNTQLIVLQENYRSHQSILDASGTVAQQIEHRLINEFEGLNIPSLRKAMSRKASLNIVVF